MTVIGKVFVILLLVDNAQTTKCQKNALQVCIKMTLGTIKAANGGTKPIMEVLVLCKSLLDENTSM